MPLRYVVRPREIRKTPRRLAEALGVHTRRPSAGPFSYNESFFFYYPREIQDAPEPFKLVSEFFHANKLRQRLLLGSCDPNMGATSTALPSPNNSNGAINSERDGTLRRLLSMRILPIPETRGLHGVPLLNPNARGVGDNRGHWVVRPLFHSGGRHYRITESKDDFIEGQEYISRLFAKDREYRIIYVFGEPLVILRKIAPPGLTNDRPWNHANGSRFVTLHQSSRLHRTTVFEDLSRNEIIKYADIIGVDVMYKNTGEYTICEFNACPSLLINDNLERIARHVQAHSRYF